MREIGDVSGLCEFQIKCSFSVFSNANVFLNGFFQYSMAT
jgi:hypothetical protein